MLSGSLPPQHHVSLGYGWRRRLPDMECSCEYIEYAAPDSRQGVIIKLGGWAGG
jgi:hypothetical protein